MRNTLASQFMLLSICFFSIQQCVAKNNNCNMPQLGPTEPLLVTIFDKDYEAAKSLWPNLCEVIKKFPAGLVKMAYRPGALATGSKNALKCGSGDCKIDRYHGCEQMKFKFSDVCLRMISPDDALENVGAAIDCYCVKDSDQLLLDNAKLRVAWKIPDNAIPTLAFDEQYDPCAKFGSVSEIENYVCQVYQKKVKPCS